MIDLFEKAYDSKNGIVETNCKTVFKIKRNRASFKSQLSLLALSERTR